VSGTPLLNHALDLVRQVIHAEEPKNIDSASVTVTGEGPDVGIILLPHQDLGGYSLVLWFDARQLSFVWAGVTDLERHDDLDLGRHATRLDGATRGNDEAIKTALTAELRRPIHVTLDRTRIRRRWQLSCAVELSGRWSETFVCDVAPPSVAGGEASVDAGLTSLMGPGRTEMRWPVPLAAWHRWADPAWRTPAESE
jgi:hypothetical protein